MHAAPREAEWANRCADHLVIWIGVVREHPVESSIAWVLAHRLMHRVAGPWL